MRGFRLPVRALYPRVTQFKVFSNRISDLSTALADEKTTPPQEPVAGSELQLPDSRPRPDWAIDPLERSLIPPESQPLRPSERPIEKFEEPLFYGLQIKKPLKEELAEFLEDPKLLTPEWKALQIKLGAPDLTPLELSKLIYPSLPVLFGFCL
jgi:hypothetical protein